MTAADDFLARLDELVRPQQALLQAEQYEQAADLAAQAGRLVAQNQAVVASLGPEHRRRLDALTAACRRNCLHLADLKADIACQLTQSSRVKPALRAYHS